MSFSQLRSTSALYVRLRRSKESQVSGTRGEVDMDIGTVGAAYTGLKFAKDALNKVGVN